MFLRRLIMACLIWFALSTTSFAQDPLPLSSEELRETANNLAELKAAREKLKAQQDFIDQSQQLLVRERDLANKELTAEKRLTAIAERERDVEKVRGDQLDALLKERNRRPSFGCRLKRIVTLGLGRCG